MCVVPDSYTFLPLPRVPLSYQASACSLSTLHFLKLLENNLESMKILENKLESLKLLENKLESMMILKNKLESLKLLENQPVDGLGTVAAESAKTSLAQIMVIDKSWTSLGKHEKAFYTGLKKFVDDCKPVFPKCFSTAKGYKLPPSYYAVKKTFKTIELGYESIHACVNDYFLFRGDANKDVHFCPVCNTSRWKDSNTPGKKVSKKVLCYFSIIPRLQHLYKSSHTAKEMTWHATGKCTKLGKMQHPVDGRARNDFDTNMWSVILTTYNLPLWLCMKESYFMLTLLIPGPKPPGKDIDVYLRPLIDDLKDLWAKPGVETIDVATGLKFKMRALVLWTINDFPARSSLSGWSGQGYKARPTCNEDTPSVRVLGKTTYVGHKRFLKKPHNWRRSLEFNGETKNEDPPREFIRDAIMTQLARLPTCVKGKHPKFGGVKIKRNVLVELNWTKRSILYELEYWSFHTLKHNLDVTHIEKNVLEKNKKKFCQSNFKHKVTDNDTNITGLKSHDCHIMMQRLLPYGLQQYLPPDVAKPLIELCLFFKQVFSQSLMVFDMLKAQSKVIDILCNLELIYPPAFFDIMIHLVIHLHLEAIFDEPICPWWIYPFKRYMKKLKNYVRNKAKPEGSIAEGYVAEEALTFSSYYFWDVTTKFNRPNRNVDFPPPTCQFQVFKSLCKSIGLRSVIRIDHQELKKVIWYVLHNNPEIDTYRAKFKIEFPNKDTKEEFPGWFGKQTPISVNSCVVNGVRFVVHNRYERHTTQNSSICSPGPDREIYYEDDPDVIHVDNSSDLSLSTSLNDLKIAALHIDGQSIDVDASPNIIDVVDEDDDIIDEEDPIPHNLADFDDEDLVNLDIDDGMPENVARGHGGDGGGNDHPPPHQVPICYGGFLCNRSKGTRKPNLDGRRAGRLHTCQETQNLRLKAITDKSGPVLIRFEVDDRETLMPLGDHAAHWANYLGELTQFNLRSHMESDRWPQIYAGIQQHLQKIYNGKKVTLKERYWVPEEDETYDLEGVRRGRPSHIFEMVTSAVREYPSLIHTFFLTHTVGGVFLNLEDTLCKQPGHIPGVERVLPGQGTVIPPPSQSTHSLESQPEYGGGSGSGACGDDELGDDEDGGEDEEDEDDC
nr:hypothetical protein [Tanacetum cinerariifolium]